MFILAATRGWTGVGSPQLTSRSNRDDGGLDDRIVPCKVAIVVPSTLEFEYARMYQADAAETQLESRVFYSRSEALVWLESERQGCLAQDDRT